MAEDRRARYGRFTGGPDPLAPPVDLSEALASMSDDVMAGYGPDRPCGSTCDEEALTRADSTTSPAMSSASAAHCWSVTAWAGRSTR